MMRTVNDNGRMMKTVNIVEPPQGWVVRCYDGSTLEWTGVEFSSENGDDYSQSVASCGDYFSVTVT